MKTKLFLAGVTVFVWMVSCRSVHEKKNESEKELSTSISHWSGPNDPAPVDTIPAGGNPAYNSNAKVVALISRSIKGTIDQLTAGAPGLVPSDQRTFQFQAIDLNKDGRDEYLVVPGPYSLFCGTGGCTVYLLGATGKIMSTFTVTQLPIRIAGTRTGNWSDLVIESSGYHLVKMKGKSYPSNPSVEPAYTGDISKLPVVADVFQNPYPSFTY